MTTARKPRVAVLGGGLAGLTAAYELSRSAKFDITVHQMGWRLGGKVATSRNTEMDRRIEEHGIHVLFGAYENAFHVFRRVYDDIGKRWKAAFEERSQFTLMEDVDGEWEPMPVSMARATGDPGDALDGRRASKPSAAPDLVLDLLAWLRDHVLQYFKGTLVERPAAWFFGSTIGRMQRSVANLHKKPTASQDRRAARRVLMHLIVNLFLIRLIGWIVWLPWKILSPLLELAVTRIRNVRRLWIGAELALATAAGLTKAALRGQDVEDLDAFDLREWLQTNGVFGSGRISRWSTDSAPLRMVYEVVFAYARGDLAKPRLAAGTAIRGLVRLLFDRRGALVYEMRAGSAETMITPLYEALLQRGVRFEFFHRIDQLELSEDGRHIDRIRFTRQAIPRGDYDPLIAGGAWPDHPKYADLVGGESLAAHERADGGRDLEVPTFTPPGASSGTLTRGAEDDGFDLVVLAIPVEALRTICAPLAARDDVWARMLEHANTTPTQSVQLWFDRTAVELGWNPQGATEAALLGTYAEPFGNWADLSVTIAAEGWERIPGRSVPKSVAYLCGPLAETNGLGVSREADIAHVRTACRSWFAEHAALLWPKAHGTGALAWSELVAPPGRQGVARYDAQYFRANTTPSERYTLTLPGTTRFRLAPDDSGCDNLFLAGDWTANGFDVGCVEAAVMSGRLASRAILGLDAATMPVYAERTLVRHHRPLAIEFPRAPGRDEADDSRVPQPEAGLVTTGR
jgi:uncharacterized protein with NAD-binding domain and iron-sulfur cluster